MPASPSSPSSSTCPRCHRPVPADAALGACPHCLLAAGFSSEPAASADTSPPPTPAELAPEFPQLELLELLGRGGMGTVYKARQRELGRLVALKLLRAGLDADPSFAERFAREARALAQLNHPGIVTLYEFGRTPGGRFFILMEFVDGVNLRQLLAAGRLAPREALAIVPPLCDALQYAHDRGLVHRDIKPENILVDRLGRIKIADFGLAKLAAESDPPIPPSVDGAPDTPHTSMPRDSMFTLTEAGKVMGTPSYMAPEQRAHPDQVDHRADIYALGVVFYQMLTGELPDTQQLQPPSQRVQLDVRLDEIVLRALAVNPALRYAAASELKTQVENVTATRPSTDGENSLPTAFALTAINPPRSLKPRFKRWALRAALGVVVLLLLRFFVIAPYIIAGSSIEPDIPAGSWAYVYKLTYRFWPGDIIAYRVPGATYVGRVTAIGPVNGQLSITRNNLAPIPIHISTVIGKVVFNTRSTSTNEHKPHTAPETTDPLLQSLTPPDRSTPDNSTPPNGPAREILLLKLAQARRVAAKLQEKSNIGIGSSSELHEANDVIALLEAELAGDPLKILQIKITAAERHLRDLQDKQQAGLGNDAEVDAAKTHLAIQKLGLESIRSSQKTAPAQPSAVAREPSSSNAEPADLRTARAELADARNRYLDSHPKIELLLLRVNELTRLTREEPSLPQNLRGAKVELAEARLRYLDSHPKIQALQRRIKELERLTREESSPTDDRSAAITENRPASPLPTNIVPSISTFTTPRLQFRQVFPASTATTESISFAQPRHSETLHLGGKIFMDESHVSDVTVVTDNSSRGSILLQFTTVGEQRFTELTRELVGKRLAILFDGRVLTAPIIGAPITGGSAQITGKFTPGEIDDLAKSLREAIAVTPASQ